MSFDTCVRLKKLAFGLQKVVFKYFKGHFNSLNHGGSLLDYVKKPILCSETNEVIVKNNMAMQFKVPHDFSMGFSAQEPPWLCAGNSWQAD